MIILKSSNKDRCNDTVMQMNILLLPTSKWFMRNCGRLVLLKCQGELPSHDVNLVGRKPQTPLDLQEWSLENISKIGPRRFTYPFKYSLKVAATTNETYEATQTTNKNMVIKQMIFIFCIERKKKSTNILTTTQNIVFSLLTNPLTEKA